MRSTNRDDEVEIIHVSGPTGAGGPPRQVPTQLRDSVTKAPLPYESRNMSAAILPRCPERVATFLGSRDKQFTIITVGGAVNTLYLRSLEFTQDIDFFNAELNRSDLSLISEAGRVTLKKEDRVKKSVETGLITP